MAGRCGSVLGLAFILAAMPALAAAADGDCKAPQTNMAMLDCAGRDYEKADAALNAAYRDVMAELKRMDAALAGTGQSGGKLAAALRDAQRAWLAFRDRQCAWEAAFFEGGSMQPLIRLTCLTEATQDRTAQLTRTWKSYGAQ